MVIKRWLSVRPYAVWYILIFCAAFLLFLSGCSSVKSVQAPDSGQTKVAVERQTTEGIVIGEENSAKRLSLLESRVYCGWEIPKEREGKECEVERWTDVTRRRQEGVTSVVRDLVLSVVEVNVFFSVTPFRYARYASLHNVFLGRF